MSQPHPSGGRCRTDDKRWPRPGARGQPRGAQETTPSGPRWLAHSRPGRSGATRGAADTGWRKFANGPLKSLPNSWVLLAQGLIGSLGTQAFARAFIWRVVAPARTAPWTHSAWSATSQLGPWEWSWRAAHPWAPLRGVSRRRLSRFLIPLLTLLAFAVNPLELLDLLMRSAMGQYVQSARTGLNPDLESYLLSTHDFAGRSPNAAFTSTPGGAPINQLLVVAS